MSIEGNTSIQEKKILVVDDNLMSRKVILFRLEQQGYDTLAALSGEDALEVIAREKIALIFLDLIMSGLSGLEVLRTLKKSDLYSKIPVVMVSGVEDADAVEHCIKAGAADFLHKPVKTEVLQEIVCDLLAGLKSNSSETAETTELSLDDFPVLDPSYLAQLNADYGGKTVLGLVSCFEEQAPGQWADMTAIVGNLEPGDLEECRRAASALKGGARTLGLVRLASACRNIERACADNNAARVAKSIELLGGRRINTKQTLRNHLAE